MGKTRIIAGKYRSRVIKFSDNVAGLRPTPNAVREKIFNWLGQSLNDYQCLDAFAGSGALGFEALSRDASHVTMLEQSKFALKDLVANQKLLQANNLKIISVDALRFLGETLDKFDLIFLDPPYDSNLLEEALKIILKRLQKGELLIANSKIYIESSSSDVISSYEEHFKILHKSKEGRGVVNYAILGVY